MPFRVRSDSFLLLWAREVNTQKGRQRCAWERKSFNMLRQQNSLCFRARLRHKSRALQRVYAKLNLVRNTNSYQRPGSKQKWIPTSRDAAAENRQNGWWKYFLIKLVWKLRCAPCVENRSSSSSFLTTQLKRRFRDQTLSLTHSSSQKSFSTFLWLNEHTCH